MLRSCFSSAQGTGDRKWIALYLASHIPSSIANVFKEVGFSSAYSRFPSFRVLFHDALC